MAKYMTVCPHDATPKNKANWIDFVVYLSRKLDKQLSYQRTGGSFNVFRTIMYDCGIVYANPLDAFRLWKSGFEVVVGTDNRDSAYLVKKVNTNIDFHTVCSVNNTYAHVLGLHILSDLVEDLPKVNILFKDSWELCVKEVLNTESVVSILYKDYFDRMSNLVKANIETISFREGNHSHYIMVNPELYKRDEVLEVLMNMSTDTEGREIMQRINVNHWIPKDDLSDLEEELKTVRDRLRNVSYVFGNT